MKRVLATIFNVITLFSLIACGGDKSSSKATSTKQESSSNITTISTDTSSIEEQSSSYEEIVVSSDTSSISSESSSLEAIYYHVTFVNYDETVLYEVDVPEGEEAIYKGEDPTKEEDDEFTYEFDGWDQDLTNIISDVTAVAQYKAVAKENWSPIIWA